MRAIRGKDPRIVRLALDTIHLDLMPQVDKGKFAAAIVSALATLPDAA